MLSLYKQWQTIYMFMFFLVSISLPFPFLPYLLEREEVCLMWELGHELQEKGVDIGWALAWHSI